MKKLKDCTCGIKQTEQNIKIIGQTDGADLMRPNYIINWYTCNECGSSHIYMEKKKNIAKAA